MRALVAILITAISCASCGAEECHIGEGADTPYGQLVGTRCVDQKGLPSRQSISIAGKKLIEDKSLRQELTTDKSGAYWIYTGPIDPKTFCPASLYFLDLSTKPPTAITFGVKNACNKFQWAKWSQNGSVIALKNNVRFRYKNGKLTPPEPDAALIQGIEMPEDVPGSGFAADSLVPFVRPLAYPDGGADAASAK